MVHEAVVSCPRHNASEVHELTGITREASTSLAHRGRPRMRQGLRATRRRCATRTPRRGISWHGTSSAHVAGRRGRAVPVCLHTSLQEASTTTTFASPTRSTLRPARKKPSDPSPASASTAGTMGFGHREAHPATGMRHHSLSFIGPLVSAGNLGPPPFAVHGEAHDEQHSATRGAVKLSHHPDILFLQYMFTMYFNDLQMV